MKISTELLSKIAELNKEIETDYPELYKFLDESPITLPNNMNPEMDDSSLEDYLETLKSILNKYKEEEGIKNPKE